MPQQALSYGLIRGQRQAFTVRSSTRRWAWRDAEAVIPPASSRQGFSRSLALPAPSEQTHHAEAGGEEREGGRDGGLRQYKRIIEARYEADIRVASPGRKASAEYRPSVHVGVEEEGIGL